VSVLLRELESLMMELESAYNAAPHLYLLLARIREEGAIDRELKEKLRQLSLLCTLLAGELAKIEREADEIRKAKRWG
jgi:uncharacterized coiled-coil DUF342 family protein